MTSKPIFFLGGPFSAALAVADGRLSFDPRLKSVIETVLADIRELGCSAFSSHTAESFGARVNETTLVPRDYQWVQDCDVYVALLPLDATGHPYRSDGTFVEIGLAIAQQKHVLMVVEQADHPERSYFVRNLPTLDLIQVADWNVFLNSPLAVLRKQIDLIRSHATPSRSRTVRREQTTDPVAVLQRLTEQTDVEEVEFRGINLKVLPGVFSPRYSHAPDFIVENWQIPTVSKVLDLGCGCGILGLYALQSGAASLVAIDRNPWACQNARLNAAELGFESKTTVLEGDAYGPLNGDDKFDVIILTPPYWNKPALTTLEAAFFDEEYKFLSASVLGALAHLNPGGRVFLGFSDQGDLAVLAQLVQKSGLFIKQFVLQKPTMRGGHSRVLYELTLS
jgi:methylase of polypeptide subunit release factors